MILVAPPPLSSSTRLALLLPGVLLRPLSLLLPRLLPWLCWRLSGRDRGWSCGARSPRAGFIAYVNEKSGYVLAVVSGFSKRRTTTTGCNAFATEANTDLVGLSVGASDSTGSLRLLYRDLIDDTTLLVVQATEEGSGPEETSEPPVGECRKCIGNGGQRKAPF